jgi:hypothetical protein
MMLNAKNVAKACHHIRRNLYFYCYLRFAEGRHSITTALKEQPTFNETGKFGCEILKNKKN